MMEQQLQAELKGMEYEQVSRRLLPCSRSQRHWLSLFLDPTTHATTALAVQELLQKDFDMLNFFKMDAACRVQVQGPANVPPELYEPR